MGFDSPVTPRDHDLGAGAGGTVAYGGSILALSGRESGAKFLNGVHDRDSTSIAFNVRALILKCSLQNFTSTL